MELNTIKQKIISFYFKAKKKVYQKYFNHFLKFIFDVFSSKMLVFFILPTLCIIVYFLFFSPLDKDNENETVTDNLIINPFVDNIFLNKVTVFNSDLLMEDYQQALEFLGYKLIDINTIKSSNDSHNYNESTISLIIDYKALDGVYQDFY